MLQDRYGIPVSEVLGLRVYKPNKNRERALHTMVWDHVHLWSFNLVVPAENTRTRVLKRMLFSTDL